jgi:hypothetical protein
MQAKFLINMMEMMEEREILHQYMISQSLEEVLKTPCH